MRVLIKFVAYLQTAMIQKNEGYYLSKYWIWSRILYWIFTRSTWLWKCNLMLHWKSAIMLANMDHWSCLTTNPDSYRSNFSIILGRSDDALTVILARMNHENHLVLDVILVITLKNYSPELNLILVRVFQSLEQCDISRWLEDIPNTTHSRNGCKSLPTLWLLPIWILPVPTKIMAEVTNPSILEYFERHDLINDKQNQTSTKEIYLRHTSLCYSFMVPIVEFHEPFVAVALSEPFDKVCYTALLV